jgi:hypothetical protein
MISLWWDHVVVAPEASCPPSSPTRHSSTTRHVSNRIPSGINPNWSYPISFAGPDQYSSCGSEARMSTAPPDLSHLQSKGGRNIGRPAAMGHPRTSRRDGTPSSTTHPPASRRKPLSNRSPCPHTTAITTTDP